MHLLLGRSVRCICFSIIFICVFLTSLTLYICSNQTCSFYRFNFFNSPYYAVRWRKLKANRQILSNRTFQNSQNLDSDYEDKKITVAKSDFNIKGTDVIVFLHIQNTGGSVFARHMVEDLQLERPCRCKKNRRICRCHRPNSFGSTWFFSRYTTGWKCGVHPDWSELTGCVDRVMDEEEGKPVKRRYFFMTMLRDPIKRFLSEFWHLRRGQSWPASRHWCGGVEATASELPLCFEQEDDLRHLSLDKFAQCRHNLAINRQSRMLSDLALVGCYNSSSLSEEDRDLIVLTSAKNNLHKMSFFGLSEFPRVSQYMFEATFGLKFKVAKSVAHSASRSARRELFKEISAKDIENVKRVNYLDAEFYHYAKELLFFRFEKLKKVDPAFENYFDSLSKSNLSTENWADKEDFLDNLLD